MVVKHEDGQAILEYILLLMTVVGAYLIVVNSLGKFKLSEKMMAPLNGDFKRAYQYGHPQALGYDDGGPENHPFAPPSSGKNNGRLFISPR
ncbi:MAG: hypothetical protein AABZ06_05150 [Bdellovibrionota bacterium]